jgi:hypothetical protein
MMVVAMVAPTWVTVCVCPPIVTVAVRLLVAAFGATVTLTVPLLLPLSGETVAQAWFELVVQDVFDVTPTYWSQRLW